MRILLVEDDEILIDKLVASLTHQQYVVDAIADGHAGLEYAQAATYDLIISDVGLPNLDGITLCKQLRSKGCTTPILLMTAKDAPDERIQGLDAGADDYLTKPLSLEELHARVRALLRRGDVIAETVLQAGTLRLDPVSCQVTYDENPLKLTPKEYSLLELFLRSPNRVFSRAHIIEHLWSFDDPPLEDSVKAHIKGLRRKLKQVGAADWIENVYGIGYRFTPQIATAVSDAAAAVSQIATTATATAVKPITASSPAAPTIQPIETVPVEQAFQASMARLWSKYKGLMTQRIDALTDTATAIQQDRLTSDLRQFGAEAAHKLAGVLGMFEQDEGTDLAREIETRLEQDKRSTLSEVPDLIQQLVTLIQIPPAVPSIEPPLDSSSLLLVSADEELAKALQVRVQAADMGWHHATSVETAEVALQSLSPELVILDIAAASMWSPSLALVQALQTKAPAVSTIALTSTDSLIDRVSIAQAGIQRLLSKPVAVPQLWEIAYSLYRNSQGVTAHLLAVDDDPVILKSLRYLLEPWGLRVTGLETPTHFWQALTSTQPDLLILDVEMPDFTGIELCQAVRIDPTWQNLPILFLTSHQDAETIQQIFRAGADDYIAKPMVGPELLTRILNRLERNRLIQTLSKREITTGLPNYLYSRQTLNELLSSSQHNSLPFSLALIQLTDLPQLNLNYDPEAGHSVLQSWGKCFRGLPGSISAGYWGSGEFVVALPGAAAASAKECLEPLLQTLRRQIVTLSSGERIQPVFCWAIATSPTDGNTLPMLYKSASARL